MAVRGGALIEHSHPDFLSAFHGARATGPNRYKARCPNPGHGKGRGDIDPSLSIEFTPSKVLLNCQAGCPTEDVLAAAGMTIPDLFLDGPKHRQPRAADKLITVEALARDKGIPAPVLAEWGLHDAPYGVGISYRDKDGRTRHTKKRTALSAKDGSYWPKGVDLMAYGEDRWAAAQQRGEGLIGEGETDTITASLYGWPMLGIPGANGVKVIEPRHLVGIDRLYVVREADRGGDQFIAGVRKRLSDLGYQGHVYELAMGPAWKDINGLYRLDPIAFPQRLQKLVDNAVDVSDEPRVGDLVLTKLADIA